MSSHPAITREHFIAKSQRAQKLLNWAAAAWLAWFIGGWALASQWLPPELRDKPMLSDVRLAALGVGHITSSLAVLFWGLNALSRRLGLFCSSCRKRITGSQVVVASGNCGHCGSTVLSLHPAQSA